MLKVKPAEQEVLNDLFDLIHFRNLSFDDFCEDLLSVRLSEYYNTFKSEAFKYFIRDNNAHLVIEFCDELLEYAFETNQYFYDINRDIVMAYRRISEKYKNIAPDLENLKVEFGSIYMNSVQNYMLSMINKNPTEAIGKAKEYIETCCKSILESKKIEVDTKWDINDLAKETLSALSLVPESVNNSDKCANNIKAILGNLRAITSNIGELRNGYGSGHGKSKNFRSLEPRHARLAVNTAIAFVSFVWETYNIQRLEKENRKKLWKRRIMEARLRNRRYS